MDRLCCCFVQVFGLISPYGNGGLRQELRAVKQTMKTQINELAPVVDSDYEHRRIPCRPLT